MIGLGNLARALAVVRARELAERRGVLAAADAHRVRAARAEAVLVALVARLDAGGRPADVLADLGVILDEARTDLQAGLPSRQDPGDADVPSGDPPC